MKVAFCSFAAAALLGTSSAAQASDEIEVEEASVYLLLSPFGEFSEDVAARAGFSSWNFMPVGHSDQQFHSYLVKVRLKAVRESFVKGKIAAVSILGRSSRRVLYASTISNLYFAPGARP